MSRTDRLGADAECDQRRLSQFSADQTGMTDPLAEIKTRLQRYPQLRFKERRGTICVSPEGEDGFPVSFHQHGDEFVVAFAGWHEHFTEVDSALACFAFGLSDAARLKVYSRCGFDYKWILESNRDGEWVEDSETGLFLFPFWCRRRVRCLPNRVIRAVD